MIFISFIPQSLDVIFYQMFCYLFTFKNISTNLFHYRPLDIIHKIQLQQPNFRVYFKCLFKDHYLYALKYIFLYWYPFKLPSRFSKDCRKSRTDLSPKTFFFLEIWLTDETIFICCVEKFFNIKYKF